MRRFDRLFPKRALLGSAILLAVTLSAGAASGPFAEFSGSWAGNGTIRPQTGNTERIRCTANYSARGANALQVRLRCASDSYNFDLTGQLTADSNNSISGQWNENSRGIGGSLAGTARGNNLQVHVESSGFSADLTMVMRGKRQDVTISSHGGGAIASASIAMSRH